ncbi:MAG TPA: hypothetical protein VF703_10780 [Pyrinomonadaceae bacterium]|jgi:hypothetical protein
MKKHAHGEFGKWLMHDDRKEQFEALFASVLTILFFALSALLLWPAGQAMMAFHLMKGYWLFCLVIYVTSVAVVLLQRVFRVDIDSHVDAYIISSLAVSGFLQAGWSAFAAFTVHNFIAVAPAWAVVILYLVGFLSCYIAFLVVSMFYAGSIYRQTNILLALTGFIIFSVWPAAGRAIYGWFFELF